jgi:hypothetical protein
MNKNSVLLLIPIFLSILLTACSQQETQPEEEKEPIKIEHKYYNIGELVESWSFDFTINSAKADTSLPSREGNKWVVLDVTFEDNTGKEDQYMDYASMYGDFVLVDDEGYFYRAYNREQKAEFYGSTRDFILFQVPVSKTEFMLFDDSLWEDSSKLDDESRDIVRIKL